MTFLNQFWRIIGEKCGLEGHLEVFQLAKTVVVVPGAGPATGEVLSRSYQRVSKFLIRLAPPDCRERFLINIAHHVSRVCQVATGIDTSFDVNVGAEPGH